MLSTLCSAGHFQAINGGCEGGGEGGGEGGVGGGVGGGGEGGGGDGGGIKERAAGVGVSVV